MDDLLLMDRVQCAGQVLDESRRLHGRQRRAAQPWLQAAPIAKLQGDERLGAMKPNFVYLNDVGVIEPGYRLRFRAQSIPRVGFRASAAEDHFDSDDAAQRLLPGLVNDTHAAAAKLFKQF